MNTKYLNRNNIFKAQEFIHGVKYLHFLIVSLAFLTKNFITMLKL